VVGLGPTAPEAFAQAATGLFALIADPAAVEERDTREVRAHGRTPESLLRAWLAECLYVLEVEGFAARRVEWVFFSLEPAAGGEPLRLHARLHGEETDPARHAGTGTVSGVSPEGASFGKIGGVFEARAVVNVY
jgi:protein archease